MIELYLAIISSVAIGLIISRRSYLNQTEKKKAFKEKISIQVDEIQKERQENPIDRFKEIHFKSLESSRYDFSKYREMVRQADLAIAKKQWGEAKKILIQCLSFEKETDTNSLKLARVYFDSGDFKRAETLYRKLLEIDNTPIAAYKDLARILTKKKKYKEAIQCYVVAVENNENDDQSLVRLGQLYELLMRHSLAAECYRRAAELKPREVEYLFFLANACSSAEDFENAIFTLEKIIAIEPYNEKAQKKIKQVKQEMEEMERQLIRQ